MKKTFIAIMMVLTLSLSLAHAQGTYTALEPLPCIPGNGITCPTPGGLQSTFNFQTYVQYTFNLVIALAAAASVFMIVLGGFQYMTTDSWTGKKDGIQKVRNALFGLLLVLTSYLILRTIDPRLVAIPANLVKPINVNYRQELTGNQLVTDILNSPAFQQQISRNPKAAADVAAAQQKLQTLSQDRTGVQDEIINLARTRCGVTQTNDAVIICRAGGIADSCNDQNLKNACAQLRKTNDSMDGQTSVVVIEAGKAAMADMLERCLSQVNFSISDCKRRVDSAKSAADQRVAITLGTDFITHQLSDYNTYAKAMLDMYGRLRTYNPNISSGIVATQLFGMLVPGGSGLSSIVKVVAGNQSVSSVVNDIQSISDRARASMYDTSMKAAVLQQSSSIINALQNK